MIEKNKKKTGKPSKAQRSSDFLDTSKAKTSPFASGLWPDANVDADGHCVQPAYAEDVRPDTGAPCRDGRDGK